LTRCDTEDEWAELILIHNAGIRKKKEKKRNAADHREVRELERKNGKSDIRNEKSR
jgi:hypothetical protein